MSAPTLRHRPIFGGVFGKGRYALASLPCIAKGLHSVRYMVIDPSAGSVLSASEDKLDALATARRVLKAADTLAERAEYGAGEQGLLWPGDAPAAIGVAGAQPRTITRRRREVFGRSDGRCHYCSTPLTLDGKWHIEHMLPRALDGDDTPINLVAACVKCNLEKRDKTALEFVAQIMRKAGIESNQ